MKRQIDHVTDPGPALFVEHATCLCSVLWYLSQQVFSTKFLQAIAVLSCFAEGLCNRYLEDTVYFLFMLTDVTRYRSVTHIKSDFTVPSCCGFCNGSSACETSIHPNSLIFLSLRGLWCNGMSVFFGGVGVAWRRLLLSLCYLGATWQWHPPRTSISLPLLLCLTVALLHNVQLWSRVVVVWCGGRHLLLSCKIPSSHGLVYV